MAKTLTAKFDTVDAERNAEDDLIDVGYPREKLFLDSSKAELKVMTTSEGVSEARELLGRHRPNDITEHGA